jgi:hypothetical protein
MKTAKKLFTIFSIITVALGAFLVGANFLKKPVLAVSVSWDGGGDNLSWSDPLNWSTDTVPTAADAVLVDADITINLASGTTVDSLVLGNSGGTTSPVLNFSYDSVGTSDPLVIDSGNLEIYGGGKITHSAGNSAVVGTINIDIQVGDLIVYSEGSIDVTGKGYYRNNGPGMGPYEAGSGYGGYGGSSPAGLVGGPSYGSIDNPLDLGSGGYNSSRGGDGGGLIKIVIANDLVLDGTINANGTGGATSSLSAGSGASGGSINISISNLWSGSGSITSNGGNGGTYLHAAGGGGGGRIAIRGYSSKTFSGTLSAIGGDGPANYNGSSIPTDGGAGTIFLQPNGKYPDILINNGSNTDVNLGGVTPISYTSTSNTIEISNYSYVQVDSILSVINLETKTNSYVIFNENVSATDMLISGDSKVFIDSDFIISQLLDLDGGYLDIYNSSNVLCTTFNFNGELVDNGGGFSYLESSTLYIPSGAILYGNYSRSYTSGLIEGTLTHSPNIDAIVNKIDYSFIEDLTISSSGSIDVSGKGYIGGSGPGAGALGGNYDGSGGGAHGGNGGNGDSGLLGGIAYDNVINPQDYGSGGGNNDGIVGGKGGGLILLNIGGALELEGSILANGGNGTTRWGYYSSGGAGGGSINISTNFLNGNGRLEAIGGTAYPSVSDKAYGGGGGGGLIYILYNENNFTGTTDVNGGIGFENGENGVVTFQISNQDPLAYAYDLIGNLNLYAGKSYSIDTVYSDPDGEDDLLELYFNIQNPDGDDIEFKVDYSDLDLEDQIPQLLVGSSYVDNVSYSIYPSYGTENEVKVTWTFDIDWSWTQSSNIEYGIKAIDTSSASSDYSYTDDDYTYKNVLEFNTAGSLEVTDNLDRPISTNSWLLANSPINWSGYKVVYENETDIYPNPDDYNIKLEDDTGRFWLDAGTLGGEFDITTSALGVTTRDNLYTLSIIDIPTGGSSTDSKTFNINIDADNPVITSLTSSSHPDKDKWYSAKTLNMQWQTTDDESGIDKTYRYISQNSNENTTTIKSQGILTSLSEWTSNALENGIYYFYILVKDIVGNEAIENQKVKIDSSIPDIVDILGAYEDQWQNINSGPKISWTDPQSLSDDTFYITTDETTPTSSNFRYATNQVSYDLPALGNGTHIVKVRGKNGAGTYSSTKSFTIKYDSIATDPVSNLEAVKGDDEKIELSWSNPQNSDFSKVKLYRNDEVIYEGNLEFYEDVLEDEGIYEYMIYAYDISGNISEEESIEYEYVLESYEIESSDNEEVIIVKQDKQTETVKEGQKSQVVLGESVEIQIPVKKLMGDIEPDDSDIVVLKVNDKEYQMELSEDRNYFSAHFVAPDQKGEHKISAIATREGMVLAQLDVDIEVVESLEQNSVDKSIEKKFGGTWLWIGIGGVFLLLLIIVLIFSKKNSQIKS